jgi:hypothetical protein
MRIVREPMKEEETEGLRTFHDGALGHLCCSPYIKQDYKIKEDEMDWGCSMYGRYHKYIQNLNDKTCFYDLYIDDRIILK